MLSKKGEISMKNMVFLYCMMLLLTGCSQKIQQKSVIAEIPMQEINVYYEYNKRPKSTFEPENSSLLLGAFIKEDKTIESIEDFEKITEKSHQIYGFTATLTEQFPMTDILECYVKEKIPLLALYPPDRNHPFQEKWLEQAAEKISQYRIPVLIDFYPNGADYGSGEDYKAYYQKAREIFRKKAPNTVFIWSMSTDDLNTWQKYYPEDVDWIGLCVYENGGEQGKNVSEIIQQWYKIFQKEKPLLLSQVGISHYSDKDAKYTEQQASQEITRLYESLRQYPQIKAVVYRSIDFTNQKIKAIQGENYSITQNQKVLTAYQNAIQTSRQFQRNWYKSFLKAYQQADIFYFSENAVVEEMQTQIANTQDFIFIHGEKYIPADKIIGYDYRIQNDAVFFYKQ